MLRSTRLVPYAKEVVDFIVPDWVGYVVVALVAVLVYAVFFAGH
jgi:hypothetical protein